MSKRQFKSQASSSRAAPGGGFGGFGGFGTSRQSTLSYLTEPPNLSSISDPNVVVSFKNLSKKDRATKARGLEDLRSYVRAQPFEKDGGVEEAILEVWVELYPRTAIDNDRYVRELSHEVQSELAKSVRKRIEKYIPKIVGTWLAGTSDRDRGVSRMAQDGIKSLFNSEDKYKAFLKRCQVPILDYALEAIKETSETLSDERNTSTDDMEAKYFRVIFSGNWQVLNLLSNLTLEDIAKCQDRYENYLLDNVDLWNLVASKDALVRKSTCELISLCLERQRGIIEKDVPRVVQAFVGKGLKAGQLNTAKVLLDTLILVETAFPQTWTTKSLGNLRKFIEKGSHGGGIEFWHSLQSLIDLIPSSQLPSEFSASVEFLNSFRKGINCREELRSNTPAAWSSYIHVAKIFGKLQHDTAEQAKFYQETVFPVFEQYLQPTVDRSQWSVSDVSVVAEAYRLGASSQETDNPTNTEPLFDGEWQTLTNNVITRLRTSLPEQSKDFHKSQQSVAAEGRRWFALLLSVLSSTPTAQSRPDPLAEGSTQLLKSATELVVSREGKPYSAAEILFESMKWGLTNDLQANDSPLVHWCRTAMLLVKAFLEEHLSKLVLSPSGSALISSLRTLFVLPEHEEACKVLWKSTIQSALSAKNESSKSEAVAALTYNDINPVLSDGKTLTEHLTDLVRQDAALQSHLLEAAVAAIEGEASWSLLENVVSYDSLGGSARIALLERIIQYLKASRFGEETPSSHISKALEALDLILKERPELLIGEIMSSGLATDLIAITDIPSGWPTPPHATHAEQLVMRFIELSTNTTAELPTEGLPICEIIRKNLRRYNKSSLSPFILYRYAKTIIRGSPTASRTSVISSVFPVAEDWHRSIGPLLYHVPQECLSMINTLKGAVALVNTENSEKLSAPFYPDTLDPHDAINSSFRFAVYTINLLSEEELMKQLPPELHVELLYHLLLFVELAKDCLGVAKHHVQMFGSPGDEESIQELMDPTDRYLKAIIAQARSWCDGTDEGTSCLVHDLIHKCTEVDDYGALAFYSARVLCQLLSAVSEAHGWQSAQGDAWLADLQVGFTKTEQREHTRGTFFTTVAILRGLGPALAESSAIKSLFIQLADTISAHSIPAKESSDTLLLLCTFEACFPVYDSRRLPFSNNRQAIFAVKQILSWTENPHIRRHALATESCRVLKRLLPHIIEVYGSYWNSTLSFCLSICQSHSTSTADGKTRNDHSRRQEVTGRNISKLHSSLDLLSALLAFKDDNEDLRDAFTEHSQEISRTLLELLQLPRDEELYLKYGPTRVFSVAPQMPLWSLERESHPLRIFDELLSKNTGWIPLEHIEDLEDLYPLIAARGWLVQSAAFDLLSRALPEKQQRISVEVILNKEDARLPDELLSLLLHAPNVEDFDEDQLAEYPITVRGYLLSWHLVFASFHGASDKVRNDYSSMLKSERYIAPLLNFMSDALGHSTAASVNLTKQSIPNDRIRSYDWRVGDAMGPEGDMRYLLVNLVYSALWFTPHLVREWFIGCDSKQTRIAIESWTGKFFTPLIIEDTMKSVTAWADSQKEAEDEKCLEVKVLKKSREVFASYEVDETAIQIVIRLGESYPLDGVKVEGINRVAVSEKKFQAWLINIQGVITFSNGYIPDGLSAFRKNVSGSLKGTEECSICYSIISANNKIPDKRCTTCNKLFHASCLFKWFKSSNQSTCPLCRNPFNYGTKNPLR